MKIHDITLPVSPQYPVWPGDPPFQQALLESMDRGAHANVTGISLSVHYGTHLDAPHHFLNDNRTVESLLLDVLIGSAQVVLIPDEVDLIDSHVLENAAIPLKTERLLLRTRNSNFWRDGIMDFQKDFVAISPDGAEWLVMHGIRLVGVDYLSVAPYKQSESTHKILLTAGIIPLEGVDLHAVLPGVYDLICLPLKLYGSDGAPARAVLIEN